MACSDCVEGTCAVFRFLKVEEVAIPALETRLRSALDPERQPSNVHSLQESFTKQHHHRMKNGMFIQSKEEDEFMLK